MRPFPENIFLKISVTSAIALSALLSSALAAQTPRLTISPTLPAPGAIVRMTLDATATPGDSIVAIDASMAGEPLHFIAAGAGSWHAIGGVPVDAKDSLVARAVVERLSGESDTLRVVLMIPRVEAPSSRPLMVDSRFTRPLDAATTARIERENMLAQEIGQHAHASPAMWTKAFRRPRASVITSLFGSGRLFNSKLTSRHLGVDFRGATGAPVLAANRGVVALADNFFLAGNVVYIDHGAGVVTGYFHLSRTLVAKGDTVGRGQKIGLVGSSGRVTGPHLHWNARYGAITVDPLDLVKLGGDWYSGPSPRLFQPPSGAPRRK